MKSICFFLSLVLLLMCASSAQALYIVEARSTSTTGLGYGDFAGTHLNSTGSSSAYGLTAALGSVYGSNVYMQPANYTYSYTLGTDVDNKAAPAYQYFGNGVYAPAAPLAGGLSGYYNVYITWPSSTNANALGCNLNITSDTGTITVGPLNVNTGGTVAFAKTMVDNPPVNTTFVGGNNAWLRIARNVLLTAGNTYTVNQVAIGTDSVSTRSAAVMWEFVSVPEPATLAILGIGAILVRRIRRS